MRERLRHHFATRAPLQSVVPDRGSGCQPLVHVAGFQPSPVALGSVRPHPGIAVRLEFGCHREGVGFDFGGSGLKLAYPIGSAQQVLDVVTHLVPDHVGGGETAEDVRPE